MEFFKISDGEGNCKVIAAQNLYEAVGYFVLKGETDLVSGDDLEIKVLPGDHLIEVSCIGFPVYQTLSQIYEEKSGELPLLIVSLME